MYFMKTSAVSPGKNHSGAQLQQTISLMSFVMRFDVWAQGKDYRESISLVMHYQQQQFIILFIFQQF